MSFIDGFIIVALVGLDMVLLDFMHVHNAKKCKYDCSKCKNWDCMKPYCDLKRGE